MSERFRPPASLEELLAIEAIKQLKARYFRGIDLRDWDVLGEVFAPDAELDVTGEMGPRGRVSGAEAIVALLRRAVPPSLTVHHGHMPEIEVLGPEEARGLWAMTDYVEFPENESGFRGYGHYHDHYVKLSGAWRIRSTRLTRLRRDPL